MKSVSMIAEDIYALGWSPKTYVPSLIGKFLIYYKELSNVGSSSIL